MEDVTNTALTISHIIQRGRPLTAASSLVAARPVFISKPQKNPGRDNRKKPSFATLQDANPKTLEPLNQPTTLIGALTLPSFFELTSPIKCSCFQFSDYSATICCDVLDFDPIMIGREIKVLAWNFIPLKCDNKGVKSGFLEIITWDFLQAWSGEVCCYPNLGPFCLDFGACDVKDKSKTSSLIFGAIESISPVFVVPCTSGESSSKNVSGFLVSLLTCQCKFCVSKVLVRQLKDLSEINVKDHHFSKTAIVYFCGSTSSWHPMMSRFIGNIVMLRGLKKRLVYIRKEESQLMHVTTDDTSLHIATFKDQGRIHNAEIRKNAEFGSYTGVITGIYMKGVVVEFDRDVILLLTEQHINVPHSVRLGAIVTLKNVHFVDPKFPWGKMMILGACFRTSIRVESFSPLETGCRLKSHSQSPLQKFIDSLSFAARLWALLVASCFRKKFAGIFSEKEILGSKHKAGMAQKYATSLLPSSAYRSQQGIMLEFCKHDLSCGAKEELHGPLRLVLPIGNLISYCEGFWNKILDQENLSTVGCGAPKKLLSCGGRTHVQSLRRILCTDEIGVSVLGKLKISLSSRRLQLVDATGEVDIMHDLSESWDFDRIFEAKGFRLVIEGMLPKLVDLDSTIYQPLSCRSIFSNELSLKRMKLSIYLFNCLIDGDSRGHSVFFELNEKSQKLENAKFHLLLLTHKFPIMQKFQGDLAKGSNMFAQAIILPWDLLLDETSRDTAMIVAPSEHKKVSVENIARHENHLIHKRRKSEQISIEASYGGLNDVRNGTSDSCSSCSNPYIENTCVSNNPLELPCVVATKGVNCYCTGMLLCANELTEIVCFCKLPMRKVLLEFDPDSFSRYEVAKIGSCYLVSDQEGDMLCSIKENYQVSRAKVNICSGTIFRSLTFSSIESLHSSHLSNAFPCPPNNGVDSKIHSEISVFVPSSALNLLENFTKAWDRGPSGPNYSLEEVDIPDPVQPVIDASMQSLSISCYNCTLPEGNLITLHGLVVALHECNDDAFPAQPKPIIAGEGYLPMFHHGNGGGVCVHVLVDSRMVRIICDVGKQTFPVGLGRDTYATFHRILVLSGQNKYMMTPVSFITINNTCLMNKILAEEEYDACTPVGLTGIPIPEVIPISLICDAFQLLEPKPMQFRCRVVAVYILVMEKAGTSAVSQSSATSVQSALGIPFAGFVIDDGSSCCCCWADSERAAMLLGLEPKEYLLQDSAETFGLSKSGTGPQCSSTINQLNQMLEKHGRIVVKNYGSVFDSSCQDLSFSVGSDGLIGSSGEDFIRSLIADAISSVSWTIDASLMDAKLCSWLQENLTKMDISIPTLLNIWATNVGHTDVLEEARNIIRGFKL
ncbi:CST complex subunit CTC1 [Striga asiatica]|uniref:CST complex subunit CTC1 n=1 Tax=Striga asiatica TaxID=4170 RepID=A0A5A7PU21_STRAF|nr:CST complex subunit CTC1 [Striga asiatica]